VVLVPLGAFIFKSSTAEASTVTVVLELIPLRGEKVFKPPSQNRILVLLGGSFQNFRRAPPTFIDRVPPTGMIPGSGWGNP